MEQMEERKLREDWLSQIRLEYRH